MVTYDLIGFDELRFIVLGSGEEGVYPDWTQPRYEAAFPIAGTNTVVVQDMGADLATIRLRLQLPDVPALRALKGRQGTVGTLTLYADYTSAVGTTYQEDGVRYEDLDGVELVRLENVVIGPGGRDIECEAVFRRPMDPLTGRRT